jgi:hypothetical protein
VQLPEMFYLSDPSAGSRREALLSLVDELPTGGVESDVFFKVDATERFSPRSLWRAFFGR